MSRLLTAHVLAERLDVAPATVLRWVREKKLPAIRLPSGAIRFREDQIDARLAEWSTGTVRAGVLSAVPAITDEEGQ